MAKSHSAQHRVQFMQVMPAKDAKYGFGRLIDLARSEPVTVEKHGRPVVVVLAVEEYKRLCETRGGLKQGLAGTETSSADAKGKVAPT